MSDEKREKGQLSPREWAEIEERWALGDVTLEQLSKEYGPSTAHLSRTLAERGVKKGSKAAEVRAEVQEAVHEQQVNEALQNMQRVAETKEEHYKYSKTLAAVVFKLLAKQIQEKKAIAAIKDDIKVLREAMQALQIARNERWAVLGLDRDPDTGEESTTLIIQEMTAQDIDQVRNRYKNTEIEDDVAEVEKLLAMATPPQLEAPAGVPGQAASGKKSDSDG